jgi:hypothetical protein
MFSDFIACGRLELMFALKTPTQIRRKCGQECFVSFIRCLSHSPALSSSLALVAICFLCLSAFGEQELLDPQEHVIRYGSHADLQDPVSVLIEQVKNGKKTLHFDSRRGYLPSLLRALRIPVSSQSLVFSKTSSQAQWTTPRTPRAIFFSDETSVGWTPGAPQIDLASLDPKRGTIFYTLDQQDLREPRFIRRNDCLQCHLVRKTLDVPSLIVRSVYTGSDGTPLAQVDGFVAGHNTPLEQRWGGWYVTGTCKADTHLGNLFIASLDQPDRLATLNSVNLTDLRGRFDAHLYLSRHSDLVALMVLEHQVRMQSLLIQANYETRYALDEETERVDGQSARSASYRRIAQAGEALLEYMLFRDEAPLKGDVHGTSSFAAEFQRRGPWDAKRRSLRQLDLHRRLFRYPCSFMVYSKTFDGLPPQMKDYLWERLRQILTGQDHTSIYDGMTEADRRDVLEILLATKPDFAAYVRKDADAARDFVSLQPGPASPH